MTLGLKKETANCTLFRRSKNAEREISTDSYIDWVKEILPLKLGYTHEDIIPAWSLHRLIEMMPEEMYGGLLCIFKDSIRYEEVIMDRLEAHFEAVGDNMYENAISCIEWLIKGGHFNKEYLV